MASSGPLYPGTITGNTGGSGTTPQSWTNTSNISADDSSLATSTPGTTIGGTSRDLIATNFGFAIPSGATIDGIVVEIKRRDTNLVCKDTKVQLIIGGTATGTDKKDTSTVWPTSLTVASYGGSTDKWGLTPTQSQVNASNFGVVVQCASYSGKGGSGAVGIDYIRITVYYTAGDPDVIDSYPESNYGVDDWILGSLYGTYGLAQSFTGDGRTLGSALLYLKKNGSPTADLTAKIYAHTGTFGTSSTPTGSALASSAPVASSTLSTSYGLITFTFSGANQITLTNATRYVLVLEGSFVGTTSVPVWGSDSSSPTHAGNAAYQTSGGGSWSAQSAYDFCFYIKVAAAVTFLARPTPLQFQAVKRASFY